MTCTIADTVLSTQALTSVLLFQLTEAKAKKNYQKLPVRPWPCFFPGKFWSPSLWFGIRPPPFFFRLTSNAFLTGWVSGIEKKKEAYHKKSRKRRPGTPALLLWSLETRRHEPKINMAEKLVDVIVKLRQRGKKGSTTETPVRQYTVKNVPVFVCFFVSVF